MRTRRTRYVSMLTSILVMGFALATGIAYAEAPDNTSTTGKPNSPAIQNGSIVKIEYTLTDDKGASLESNKGLEPLQYTHGQRQIIPGLEKALDGLRAGDVKHIVVPPDEAYGPFKPEATIEVPKKRIPANLQTVGTSLLGQGQNGQPLHARVKEVKEQTIVLDVNHPMAGKVLTFDVKILEVEAVQTKQ